MARMPLLKTRNNEVARIRDRSGSLHRQASIPKQVEDSDQRELVKHFVFGA